MSGLTDSSSRFRKKGEQNIWKLVNLQLLKRSVQGSEGPSFRTLSHESLASRRMLQAVSSQIFNQYCQWNGPQKSGMPPGTALGPVQCLHYTESEGDTGQGKAISKRRDRSDWGIWRLTYWMQSWSSTARGDCCDTVNSNIYIANLKLYIYFLNTISLLQH